ncbi:MAG: hypothetical protein CME06_04900, partial [Gemmatimonadetes bacterium]|nr:hypothetical protein [Gemmatimonadota bacterium]
MVLLGLLAAISAWISAQGGRFDPADRDLAPELLLAPAPRIELYQRPPIHWAERGGGGAAEGDLGVFPASILDGGWRPEGGVDNFNPSRLYEKINGAAEQFIRFGFRGLRFLSLAKDGRFITVELYDQTDAAGAIGIFVAQRAPERAIEERDGARLLRTPLGFVGILGRHYFKITGSEVAESITRKTEQIVGVLIESVEAGAGDPVELKLLIDGFGAKIGEIGYEPDNVFRYEFLSRFWFATRPKEMRVFLHRADSDESARRLFGRIAAEHRFEYEVVPKTRDRETDAMEYTVTLLFSPLTLPGSNRPIGSSNALELAVQLPQHFWLPLDPEEPLAEAVP